MAMLLNRPASLPGPGAGFARNELFQVAYATNDMDRAKIFFAEKLGVREFSKIEAPLPEGGHVRIEIAWASGMMYELMHGVGAGSEVFNTFLPKNEFAVRPHHLGYFVPSQEAWDAVLKEIERDGRRIVRNTDAPGFLKAVIVDAPELGHYLEYILPEAGGLAFFQNAPNN